MRFAVCTSVLALALTCQPVMSAPPGEAAASSAPGAPPPGPPPEPLTPAQEMVKALPPVQQGGMYPLKPLAPDAPMPSADPHDLRGTWAHSQPIQFRIERDMFGSPLPYTDAGAQVLARRLKADRAGRPYANASTLCRPPGQPWQLDINFPFQIFQRGNLIEFVFEEYHGRWNIALDRATLPSGDPGYMGRSVGHWQGDTLVVETTGFKRGLWFEGDGTPLSAAGKLIHRIRKADNGDRRPYLEIVTTVIDPQYYTKPWSVVRSFSWQPDLALFKEYNCEEQIGAPTGPDAGFAREPQGE